MEVYQAAVEGDKIRPVLVAQPVVDDLSVAGGKRRCGCNIARLFPASRAFNDKIRPTDFIGTVNGLEGIVDKIVKCGVAAVISVVFFGIP